MNIVVYIHGKGGNINEAKHYRQLFPAYDVIGIDYKSSVPWEAREEIHNAILDLKEKYEKIILIANSIGTFFTMNEISFSMRNAVRTATSVQASISDVARFILAL